LKFTGRRLSPSIESWHVTGDKFDAMAGLFVGEREAAEGLLARLEAVGEASAP
jgi:hypothetical protein